MIDTYNIENLIYKENVIMAQSRQQRKFKKGTCACESLGTFQRMHTVNAPYQYRNVQSQQQRSRSRRQSIKSRFFK